MSSVFLIKNLSWIWHLARTNPKHNKKITIVIAIEIQCLSSIRLRLEQRKLRLRLVVQKLGRKRLTDKVSINRYRNRAVTFLLFVLASVLVGMRVRSPPKTLHSIQTTEQCNNLSQQCLQLSSACDSSWFHPWHPTLDRF